MNQKILKCKTCLIKFKSVKSYKAHFNSDWHAYNYKRKVVSMAPVSEEEFETKRRKLKEKERIIRESNQKRKKIECRICKKTFKSESTLAHHLQSKKHAKAEFNFKRKTAFKKKLSEKPDNFEIQEHVAEENEILDCLFCKEFSLTWQENVKHMRDSHGFVIPEKRSCLSFTSLIRRLHRRIKSKRACLVCEMSFETADAAKNHMKDKSHCRLQCPETLNDLSLYNHLGMNVLKLKKIINRFGDLVTSRLEIENEDLAKLILEGQLEKMVVSNEIREGLSMLDVQKSQNSFSIADNTQQPRSEHPLNILDELSRMDDFDEKFEIVSDSLSSISISKEQNSCLENEASEKSAKEREISGTDPLPSVDHCGQRSSSASSGLQSYTQLDTTKYSNHPFLLTDMIHEYCSKNVSESEAGFRVRFLSCDLDIRKMVNFPGLILRKLAKINENGELMLGDRIYGNKKYRHIYRQKVGSLKLASFGLNALESSHFDSIMSDASDFRVRSFHSYESSKEKKNKNSGFKKIDRMANNKKVKKSQSRMEKAQMKLSNLQEKKVKRTRKN